MHLIGFIPFDPETKRAAATYTDASGAAQSVAKGALSALVGLAPVSAITNKLANDLEVQGFRVLAVAAGASNAMIMLGFFAPATAAIVAQSVGLNGAVCPVGAIPADVRPEQFSVLAGVLPEDKYNLVWAFQNGRHIVGMCGAVALVITGHANLTPLLMVIIMITGDFLGMSLTTDRVRPSPTPNAWHTTNLAAAALRSTKHRA
jgi:hypothetical protein